MFCDSCGTAVQPGQAFCGKCGKAIVGPVTALQMRPGRVQGHVQLLGIMWLAISAFNTIGGVILYVIANTLFAHLHNMGAPQTPTSFLRPFLSVIAGLVLIKAAAGFIAGWGLLQREPWARFWVSSLFSTSPSARPSESTPCGFFFPPSRKRNTTPWPLRAPHKCAYSLEALDLQGSDRPIPPVTR
jgi:hypothetical protein